MNTRTILTAAAGGALALAGIAGTVGGFATGRATAPTPDACIVALGEGERVLGLAADALELSADAVVAAATWDTAALERITLDVEGITADMGDGVEYRTAAAECRDGAR